MLTGNWGFFCSVPGSLLQPVCSQKVGATSTTLTGPAAETAKADLTQSSEAIGAPWQRATWGTRTGSPFAGWQLWVGKGRRGTALVRQKAVSRPSDSTAGLTRGGLLPLAALLEITITKEP